MDAIREFFYWTASIALILFSLFMLGLIALMVYLKRLANRGFQKLDYHMNNAADTWKKYTWSRIILRALRMIF